jgi:hypothetical protein
MTGNNNSPTFRGDLFHRAGLRITSQPGHALDDWLQAEFELTHWPLRVLRLSPIESSRNAGSPRHRSRGGRTATHLAYT